MEEEILRKIEMQEKKLEEIHSSVKRIQTYFLWTLIITIVLIVLPIIGLIFIIPQFLSIYSNIGNF
jgi:type II secretory pathway component PulF